MLSKSAKIITCAFGLLAIVSLAGCQDLKRQLEKEAAEKSLAKNRPAVPSMVGLSGLSTYGSQQPGLQCPPGTTPKYGLSEQPNSAQGPDYCVSAADNKSTDNMVERYSDGRPKTRYLHQGDVLQVSHWHQSGNLKEQTYFTNGAKNGLWRSWHENGKPQAKGHYENDKKAGEFIYWNALGVLTERGAYANDLKTGLWISYHDGKRPKERSSWVAGKRNGNSETLSIRGHVLNHGAYSNDLPTGRWINYYENGRVQSSGDYLIGQKTGRWTEYGENGRNAQVAFYKNGVVVDKPRLAANLEINNSDTMGAPPPLPLGRAPQGKKLPTNRSTVTKGPGWQPL